MPIYDPLLPHFARAHELGCIELLGEKVPTWISDPKLPLNSPCLYEFSLFDQSGNLLGAYVGQASSGIGRPIEQYEKVLSNLRMNRLAHLRRGATTKHPYKQAHPWSFRWIHHELERVLWSMSHGSGCSVELCIQPLSRQIKSPHLNEEEKRAIAAWRERDKKRTLNRWPCIAKAKNEHLDSAWKNEV